MKRLFAGLLAGLLVISLSACGGNQTTAPAPASGTQPSTAPAPAEKITIRWLNSDDPKVYGWEKIYPLFKQKHPNIDVEIIHVPNFRAMHDKGKAMMAANDAPDIIRIDDDFVAGYAVRDLLLPLDDLFTKHKFDTKGYHQDFRGWARVNGKQYALPIGMHARALFVNEDMFKAAGVPLPPTKWADPSWKWNDMLNSAKKLSKPDQGIYGVSILNDNGFEETWSRSNGGMGTYAKDGRSLALADDVSIEAYQWLADLIHVHKVHPPYSSYTQMPIVDQFVAGRVAMFMGTNGNINNLRKKIGNKFTWSIRPLPMQKTVMVEGSINTHAIPKNAKNPDAAFLFLKFLTSEESQKIIASTNWAFPVHPEWAEKYYVQPNQAPKNQEVFVEGWKKYFMPVAKTVNDEQVTNLYRRPMQAAWAGEKKVAEILKPIKAEADKLLKEFPDAKLN